MFSVRLKSLRENHKMSQAELATIFGISQGTIGNWESGIREPNSSMLIKLSDFFNVTIDYLLGHSTDNPIAQVFSQQEKQLINNYRQLNEEGQEKLLDHSIDLVSSGRYIKSDKYKMDSKKA